MIVVGNAVEFGYITMFPAALIPIAWVSTGDTEWHIPTPYTYADGR